MGRLKAMPARLGGLPSRVRALPKTAERFYTSPEWKQYRRDHRAWAVRRDGGCWCAVCGAGGRLILDHKVERKDGGADFPPYEGCEWLCTGCHNAKTAQAKAARVRKVGGG
ncbi:MAG: HNH endonuclease [Erythrobacteraceae bacterium]|nr:HNH endonuclease [Erythrobacteraceae bacterium]